jgi:hypothetical protein
MKHIKTYKLFENNQSTTETICEEIKDILLPLKDDAILKIDIDIDHRQDGEFIYLKITDIESGPFGENLYGIKLDEFSYEFKQLFSYMKSEGWEIDYENRPYHKTNDFIRFPYVELTEPDLICPECDSNQTSPASSDHDETECKCYDCGHRSDIDDFKKYLIRIEEESMFFDFIKRDLDKIFIKFIKE